MTTLSDVGRAKSVKQHVKNVIKLKHEKMQKMKKRNVRHVRN